MFPFIKTAITKGYISPTIGRLIEASIVSAISYLIGVLYTGEMVSQQALIQAVLAPILMYLNKGVRTKVEIKK